MLASWSERAKTEATKAWEWVKSFFPSKPPDNRPRKQYRDPPKPQPAEPQQAEGLGRFQVQDGGGGVVMQSDDLTEALEAWQTETSEEGVIIDTEEELDITPEKDDNGRYVVLDDGGEQVGTFSDFDLAERIWEEETDKEGRIIDTLEEKDVTPYEGHLTDEEVEEAAQLVRQLGGRGYSYSSDPYGFDARVDPDNVAKLIERINKLRLPIFELANAVGDGHNIPTHTVTVTKREAVVEEKQVPFFEDVPLENPPTTFQPSPIPQDYRIHRPMRDHEEVARVDPVELVMPGFDRRFARKELPVRENQEERPGDVRTKRVRKMRTEQTITPREWEEEIEVSEEPRVQNLAIVCDLSGSMFWDSHPNNAEIAVALCAVLITKHLRDESRYSFRWFADHVDSPEKADSKRSKEKLIKFILATKANDSDIGGGTYILGGLLEAARDVRKLARKGEIPEVLLITDGQDYSITAESVFDAIGSDVVLHAVMINGSNSELKKHSTTYDDLSTSRHGLKLSGGQPPRHYR